MISESLVGLTMLKVIRHLERHGFFWITNYNKIVALVVKPGLTVEEFDKMVEVMRAELFGMNK